jgi:DNA mismatch repair protein MutL
MLTDRRSRIAVLPPAIAARIAAGEVIERPASVVKELIENALDAGARRIDVLIEEGGVTRIRVRDDGCGIPPDQLADAFERHATSKLRRAEDLYAVETLGFRGEALASIAAAADVDLTTRPPGEAAAATARLREGALDRLGAAAAAPGTTVDVRELFAALPARRRFLRSAAAEARAVTQVVAESALAYPAVAFRLESGGRELLQAPGSGALRDVVRAVHGATVADTLLPLDHVVDAADGAAAEGTSADSEATEAPPQARIEGLIGAPALHRGNRRYLHLIVNGRPIVSRALVTAVEQGYQGLMPAGRHPVAVVAVTLPGEQVDVNVHPTKSEVRFRHERFVFTAVRRAVLAALADLPLAATPGESWLTTAPVPAPGSMPGHGLGPRPAGGRDVLAGARAATPPSLDQPAAPRHEPRADPLGVDGAVPGEGAALPLLEGLPMLRPLGQVSGTYVVAEAPDGLYLVDQHAAHERVLYERIAAARGSSVPDAPASERALGSDTPLAQPLLAPALVELSAPQAALAAALADELAAVGWQLETMDGHALLLRAVPQLLHGDAVRRRSSIDPAQALREQLDAVDAEERLTGPDRVVATLACRAAVRAGDTLASEQQRALLSALEAAATPQSCPHGRPTMLHLSETALARAFGRSDARGGGTRGT